MTSVRAQHDAVNESCQALSPPRQYTFALLMVERLLTICRNVFPAGLPTKETPYSTVDAAMEQLWSRIENPAELRELSLGAAQWKPLQAGHVEHRPGAAIGFHVASAIERLAAIKLDRPMDEDVDTIWNALDTTLFRLDDAFDYSQPIAHAELDSDLNEALLLEYRLQTESLTTLSSADSIPIDDLRAQSRQAAETMAEREHNYLANA